MDDGANGPGDNAEAIDMDNIEIDAMNVSDEKTFLITKRKMILKKIQQDFRAQKSYEVHKKGRDQNLRELSVNGISRFIILGICE